MEKKQGDNDILLTKKLQILVGKRIENREESVAGIIAEISSYNNETMLEMKIEDEWEGEYYLRTTSLLGGITLLKSKTSNAGSGKPLLTETFIGGRTFGNAFRFVFEQK